MPHKNDTRLMQSISPSVQTKYLRIDKLLFSVGATLAVARHIAAFSKRATARGCPYESGGCTPWVMPPNNNLSTV